MERISQSNQSNMLTSLGRNVMRNYELKILSEEDARQICTWKYDNEYSIYNLSDWEIVKKNVWDLAIKEKREKEYISVIFDNELIAYGRISEKEDIALIGIGIKPELCGKGHGKNIMELLVQESEKRYIKHTIALEVRSFNKRALSCYKKVGIKVKDRYIKKTSNGKEDEFYYMELV